MCADLFDRVGEPVNQALRSADMTMVMGHGCVFTSIHAVCYTVKSLYLLDQIYDLNTEVVFCFIISCT